MSLFSFLRRSEEEVTMLIDIGSGSITVGLVSFTKAVPEFLYCVRNSFPINERSDRAKLLNSMSTLLDSVLAKTVKQGLKTDKSQKTRKINKVVISFSTPWHLFKSKKVQISENEMFVVNKTLLKKILDKEEDLFRKEYVDADNKNEKLDWTIIEKSIIHTKINGYFLEDSIGKKAKMIDVFVYLSAIERKVKEKILSIVSKHTHINKENILPYTFPLVFFSTIRDNFSPDSDFFLMNITSESTEISLVEDNVMTANYSFPLGRDLIIRLIAKKSKVSSEIAESILRMYLSSKLEPKMSLLVEKVLIDIEAEWSVYIEDAIHSLCHDLVTPKRIFITANQDVASIFINFLKMKKVDSTSNFRKNLEITLVDTGYLANHYKRNSKVEPDEFIVILSDFYKNLEEKNKHHTVNSF